MTTPDPRQQPSGQAVPDAADMFLAMLLACAREEITEELAHKVASSAELAQAATLESCGKLAAILRQLTESGEDADLLVASLLFSHANGLTERQLNREALLLYDTIEPIVAQHGLDIEIARCRVNRATALQLMGRHAVAVADYDQAEPIFAQHGLDIYVATCRMNRGEALRQMGLYAEAVAEYEQINFRCLAADRGWMYHQGLGRSLWQVKERDRALEQFTLGRHALRQARRTGGIDETSLEFVAERQGLVRDAVRHALEADLQRLAFEAVQDGKAGVLGDLRQRRVQMPEVAREQMLALRAHLGRWLHSEADRSLPAKEVQRETRARTQAYLKTWSVARAYNASAAASQPEYSTFREEAIPLEQIQAALPVDWALLDFWVLDGSQVKVFVVTKGGLRVETVEVPFQDQDVQDALNDLMGWHLTAKEGRDKALEDFYYLLFKPLKPLLQGVRGLYLVPHDYLHLIPLHACSPEEGRYLCDDFAVAYLPSASLLPQLPPLTLNGSMLTLANPDRGTDLTLPFSEWEAEHLQQTLALPQHQVHAGPNATVDRTTAWQQKPIAHFTCHGFGHPQFAALSHLRLRDDVLLAHDVVYRQPPLPDGALAILNGCQTGVRELRAVDEGMGLMTAFLLRGASLVFATQWSVADLCAAEMVSTFLEELVLRQQSPTEALRAAQRRARQITAGEVVARCEELKRTKFPPEAFPHEAAGIYETAARACLVGGDLTGAQHYAHQAASVLRKLGRHDRAARAEELVEKLKQQRQPSSPDMNRLMYDHPVYWSAFQLVGRVT